MKRSNENSVHSYNFALLRLNKWSHLFSFLAENRNHLSVSTIRIKKEVAHLTGMEHILRPPDLSLVAQALLE